MSAPLPHDLCVDGWLTRLDDVEPLQLLELAMAPLWKRASSTLGSITLGAIVQRVRLSTIEKHPSLEGLEVTEQGVRLTVVTGAEGARDDLRAGVRYFLVQFLTVIGALTAEILTPALHATLAETRFVARTGIASPRE